MNISVELVKQLRDMTLASLKDCKECLVEAWGDITKAQELLKKKWIASAGKKWDRETKEGKVAYKVQNNTIAILKLWCETDFVAKNELFDQLMEDVLTLAIDHQTNSFETLPESVVWSINERIAQTIGTLWENMKVVWLLVKPLPSSKVYVYTHAWSKLIAAVYYDIIWSEAEVGVKKAALQIAAMDPTYLSIESIPTAMLDTMKAEFEQEVRATGKPDAVIPNIVAWKLNKKYSEIVLLEQGYVGDESQKIKDIIANQATLIWFDRVGFGN